MLTNTNLGSHKRSWLLVGSVVTLLLFACIIGSMTALPEEYGMLPLALVLGICGALLIFRWPLIGIALIIFVLPIGPFTRLIGERTIGLGVGILLLGIYGARVLVLHEKIKLDRVSQLVCAFGLWAILTSFWAYDFEWSLIWALKLIQMLVMYVLILNYCRTERQLNILTLSFAAGAIVTAIAAFLVGQRVGVNQRLSLSGSRYFYYYDPNIFAMALIIGVILAIYCLYKTRRRLLKAVLVLGIVIIGYAVIQAQSRGAWIAISTSFLISLILGSKDPKLIKRAILIMVVLIGVGISAYYLGIINDIVINRFETLLSGDSRTATAGRSEIWKVGLEMIKGSFPFGVGFNNFAIAFDRYISSANVFDVKSHRGPHSTFLAILAETGLIGFILFVSIFIYLFRNIFSIRDAITRLICMWILTCLMLSSSFVNTHFTPAFWFILLLVALRAKFEGQSNQRIIIYS